METLTGLRSWNGVPVTQGRRYPVSPKAVLFLFKVSKMTNFNYELFKYIKMTNFNYDLFKISKMTNFNYELLKVSKM